MQSIIIEASYNSATCQRDVRSIFITYKWDNEEKFTVLGAIGGPLNFLDREVILPFFTRRVTFRLSAVEDSEPFTDVVSEVPSIAFSRIFLATSCTNITPPRYEGTINFLLRSTPPVRGISLFPSSITGSSCCGFPITILRERKVKCGKKKKKH